MKSRFDEKLMIAAFCGFLGVMSLLFLLLPKEKFSALEKRYLSDAPVLTWENLSSGKFGSDVESYMADYIPGRNFFVGLNAYVDLFTGRQVSKGVYAAEGNRLVQAPVVWNEKQAQQNMQAINSFAEKIGRQVDLMLVPSAGWAAQDTIVGLSDPYEDEALIQRLYDLCGEDVRTIDLTSVIKDQADPASLYYRTDHHWTTDGAYLAYETYMQLLGRDYRAEEDFTVETASGFQGSTYSESALWLTPGEDIEMWHGSSNITVTNGENPEPHQGVFYKERLEEADKYTVFLDGNHSIVRITNPDAQGKGKLLVIRDSYSNCLGTLLTESYEEVVLVDLRYYKNPVSQLCAEENFTDVLVCYSMDNIMTDTNLVWLQ